VEYEADLFSEEKLRMLLPFFCGEILQVPPAHSAIKIQGRPAYALARAGEKLNLAARPVRIHEIELLSFTASTFFLRVRCGSGTYIRSLIHDVGQRLGTGALMVQLRRLSVGVFSLKSATTLESPVKDLEAAVIPLEKVIEAWPSFVLDENSQARLRQGQPIPLAPDFPSVAHGVPVAAFYEQRLVSIVALEGDRIKVLKNIVLK
jgi:tRNA pseudouridine55 synthase